MIRPGALLAIALMSSPVAVRPALAQSAAIEGRAVDQQQAAVPGVLVSLVRPETGYTRETTTDSQGAYRVTGVPPGIYDIRASLDGFATVEQRGTIIDVGAVVRLDFALRVSAVAETVDVVAPSPLVQVATAAIGGVVDERRIQELPLNGRQFANLAATLPGVGVGFHRDPTKSTEYMPQAGGGNGRNIGYVVDGVDNADVTVGGPLVQFPLDAIEEFRFTIAGYSAESGRASGGVMSIVTKSGTNRFSGSGFTLGRDEALNARTTTEKRNDVPKPDYNRWVFGGSGGGPVVKDAAHFFAAAERLQQDTFQAVDTLGLFPAFDGVWPIRYRDNQLTGKLTIDVGSRHRIAVRDAINRNSQPQGAAPLVAPETWGDTRNRYHSLSGTYGVSVGSSAFNEIAAHYATFDNVVLALTEHPNEFFPNGVTVGHSLLAPQATTQRQVQVRDDLSKHVSGHGGLAHALKTGGGFVRVMRLGSPPVVEPPGYLSYNHLDNTRSGAITSVSGNAGSAPIVEPGFNSPLTHLNVYAQDDWRATNRMTVNVGVRYDLALGYQLDQSHNPNFVVAQQAGAAGRFRGVVGFEDFGQSPRVDTNNFQPRLGLSFDLRGNGADVARGGWGIFTDAAFTNANILFASADARGPIANPEFNASNPNGLRKPDGSFFRVGDPISSIAGLNEGGTTGLNGEFVSPLFEQPYTRQLSAGWSHQLDLVTAFTADYIHADGRDLSLRMRLNTRVNGGARRFADLPFDPNGNTLRAATSQGTSQYDALILGIRRRTASRLDLAASYTLAKATALFGAAADETGLTPNTILDATNPFSAVESGPTPTDARHRITASAIVPLKWGVQVAPILFFRTALPVNTIENIDRNRDGAINELPDRAFAYDGIDRPARDIGACETINCGRGSSFTQLNLRVSKMFNASASSRIELIAEGFNLFNASNPSAFNPRRTVGGLPSASFMQPASFAGDFQQPEQRVGQIGVKVRFGK